MWVWIVLCVAGKDQGVHVFSTYEKACAYADEGDRYEGTHVIYTYLVDHPERTEARQS